MNYEIKIWHNILNYNVLSQWVIYIKIITCIKIHNNKNG